MTAEHLLIIQDWLNAERLEMEAESSRAIGDFGQLESDVSNLYMRRAHMIRDLQRKCSKQYYKLTEDAA